ncbi:MAG TPA: hypothetical protein VFC78_17155, partial [Tepidisphaeraceae bacterium]|nr:hypothetical protein [Tepidisphaeraceae bacterium]
MTMRYSLRASTYAVLTMAVAGFGLTGCGLRPPPPFDPIGMQQPEVAAAPEAPLQRMEDLPTTMRGLTTQPNAPSNDSDKPAAGQQR